MPAGASRLGFWYLNQTQDINFLADWMILTYTFKDGVDLDTRTKIIAPGVPGPYVGWGQGVTQENILTWGGDNTGTGLESVLVDVNRFRRDYPSSQEMLIDTRCMWYGSPGLQAIVLAAKLYKGGTMERDGFTWRPVGATAALAFNSQGKVISYYSRSGSDIGYHFAYISYNVNTGTGGINNADVADVENVPSGIVDEK